MPEANPELALVPLGGAAARLRVPRAWLKAEALAGRVPCLQAGGALLFNLDVVRRIRPSRLPSRSPG